MCIRDSGIDTSFITEEDKKIIKEGVVDFYTDRKSVV